MATLEQAIRPGGGDRPNLLIVYPDQWRATALGCAGDTLVQTPALDGLAAESADVARAYTVNPVCTPSRSSFLTARYPHATGVTGNNAPLPEAEVGFAEVLAAAGYRTGYIGKWHLDGADKPGFVPPGPRRHGFDHWAAFNRGHEYYAPVYYRDDDRPIAPDVYEPDMQTDLAAAFVEDPDPRPFCLLLAWGPPHTPLVAPPHTAGLYREEDMPVPASVPESERARARRERAAYYGLITSLDLGVDRLLRALRRSGRERDTVVCFTSDHGYLMGEHGFYGKERPQEEAVHVPFLVRWPGRIPPGRRDDLLLGSVDAAPTLLGLLGLAMPAGIHGRDLSGVLAGRAPTLPPPDALYLEGRMGARDEWRAVRTARHMLAVGRDGEPTHLYDMNADPLQMRNLVADAGAARLRADLAETLRNLARAAGDPLLGS